MGTTIESDWENARLIEELAAARAEIERLNTSPTIEACRQMIENAAVKEASELHKQLADEQAKNVGLRDVINRLQEAGNREDDNEFYAANSAATKILSAPPDAAALEALIAKAGEKMRERCEKVCDEIGDSNNGWCCEGAIRALPGVTLEDLK